jgi:hypothetical protein
MRVAQASDSAVFRTTRQVASSLRVEYQDIRELMNALETWAEETYSLRPQSRNDSQVDLSKSMIKARELVLENLVVRNKLRSLGLVN